MKDDLSLKGLTAIITGGSRGLGLATATYLGEMGANIFIADINEQEAEKSAKDLKSQGIAADSCYVDVSNIESVEHMINNIHDSFGDVSILVNNAGILDDRSIPEISQADWIRVLNVNLSGVHYCSRAVLPDMMKQKFGKIVNLGSMAGQTGGLKAGVNYASSKAGVFGLTKSYARYCAKYGITVNAVAPGLVLTEMTKDWAKSDDIPMQRLGDPLEVARVIYFLVSPLSSYVTGQVISINGGIIMP